VEIHLFVYLINIDWAVLNGMKDVVLLLLDYKADVTIKNKNDKSPSEEAFDRAYYDISEKIAEKEPTTIIEENDNTEDIEDNN
jgi:hypothetical protein